MKIVFLILAALMFGYAAYLFFIQFKMHEPESKLTVKCIIAFAVSILLFIFFYSKLKKSFFIIYSNNK